MPPAGSTHLRRRTLRAGWEVGAGRRGGAGWTGTSCHLARRPKHPERGGDERGEGGAQEEGGVVPEEQQHVAGMLVAGTSQLIVQGGRTQIHSGVEFQNVD